MSEQKEDICGTCIEKMGISLTDPESIWSFNPFYYDSFQSMKRGFYDFYNKIKNKTDFYKKYNEEGYTYSQWYIYYLSNNMYKYKKLHKQVMWFFQVISSYPFFRDFIKIGKEEDRKHNTLHHFLKYMTNMGKFQDVILNLLLENGLSMHTEDNDGFSPEDYMNNKVLSEEDHKKRDFLTKEYKEREKELDQIIFQKIGDKMKKCKICLDFISKYEDIQKYKEYIKSEDNIEIIKKIIYLRQECIFIYKKYEDCSRSIERHQYIVDIYLDTLGDR